jgi:hypothetical protein
LGVFGEAIFGGTMDVFSEESLKQDNFCSRLMLTNENLHVALLVPKVEIAHFWVVSLAKVLFSDV